MDSSALYSFEHRHFGRPDTARDVLNHEQQRNTLNKRYTGGATLLDLSGLCRGEALSPQQQIALEQSTYVHSKMYGLAAKAISSNAARNPGREKACRPHQQGEQWDSNR
ncbi:unnamed protein product [Sympodiomycopsis kandeliae]